MDQESIITEPIILHPAGNGSDESPSSRFLAPENLCGQTLLSTVSRGHSILADIRILSERIPAAFSAAARLEEDEPPEPPPAGLFGLFGGTSAPSSKNPATNKAAIHDEAAIASSRDNDDNDTQDVHKYAPFLFDFSYLHNPEEWEASLTILPSDADPDRVHPADMADLEREFAVNHKNVLEEFHDLFYSIYEYQAEVNRFAEDLSKGYFIRYTVESVLLDGEGRALLCEAVWLYGVMLIMMERFLPVSLLLGLFTQSVISFCLRGVWYLREYHIRHLTWSNSPFNIYAAGADTRTTHHRLLPFLRERRRHITHRYNLQTV